MAQFLSTDLLKIQRLQKLVSPNGSGVRMPNTSYSPPVLRAASSLRNLLLDLKALG